MKKQQNILEFGSFQWEIDPDDISNKVHSQEARVFIEELIKEKGSLTNWNRYIRYTPQSTRSIYENGLFIDRILGVGVRGVLSPASENRIIDNFFNGKQTEIAFEIGDPVSNKLIEYYQHPARTYVDQFIARVLPIIKEGGFNDLTGKFVFDIENIPGAIGRPDFSNPSEIPFYDFYGIMGGTQKIKVEMELKTITQEGGLNYDLKSINWTQQKLNATFHIIDWYGTDEDDINEVSIKKDFSESLKAFFMLQHYWGIGFPFQTRISAKLINELTIR